jgi:cephalosporin hydroxylase
MPPPRRRASGAEGGSMAGKGFPGKVVAAGIVVVLAALNVYQYADARRRLRAETEPDRVIERFHRLYYDSKQTWYNSQWLGVRTMQNPNDVWITQEIISELKPDVIVEAGTAAGGSALIWAMVLSQVNPAGRVITIDINDYLKEARERPIFKERVDFLKGSSTAPEIVAEVKRRTQGKRVLVLLDSNHVKDHVAAELKAYSPLVGVGGYIIVQDTDVNGHPVFADFGPGPMEAVEEFLAGTSDFESDRSRERLLFTMHPKGYLRRVRDTASAS